MENKNGSNLVTIDLSDLGYTGVIQLEQMLWDPRSQTNERALDDIHAWIEENASDLAARARANKDYHAAEWFEDMEECDEEEGPDDDRDAYTLPADDGLLERLENFINYAGLDVTQIAKTNAGGHVTQVTLVGDPDDIQDVVREAARAAEEPEEDGDEGFWPYLSMAVQAWRDDPANEDLDSELEGNAPDARNDPGNLFRAGVFEGLATAAAWAIYRQPNTPDDINAVKAAIYKAYGVAR